MATAAHHQAGVALPRPLIAIGVPCAGVLLVAFFLIRGFPYQELGDLIATRIAERHGIQLVIGEVGPTMQLAGPAIEGTQLRAKFPDGKMHRIDRALVRPAWSFSWFAGDPALHVEVESPAGKAGGTLRWNGRASWVGTFEDARPELPPIADWIPIGSLEGSLEAKLQISAGELGPEGQVEFEVRDGSITLPNFSAPIPFGSLTGAVSIGGDAYAKVVSLNFEGPNAVGSGTGKIGRAERMSQAPIGFEFKLDVKPPLQQAVRAAGVKIDAEGSGLAKFSGTVGAPKIR